MKLVVKTLYFFTCLLHGKFGPYQSRPTRCHLCKSSSWGGKVK